MLQLMSGRILGVNAAICKLRFSLP